MLPERERERDEERERRWDSKTSQGWQTYDKTRNYLPCWILFTKQLVKDDEYNNGNNRNTKQTGRQTMDHSYPPTVPWPTVHPEFRKRDPEPILVGSRFWTKLVDCAIYKETKQPLESGHTGMTSATCAFSSAHCLKTDPLFSETRFEKFATASDIPNQKAGHHTKTNNDNNPQGNKDYEIYNQFKSLACTLLASDTIVCCPIFENRGPIIGKSSTHGGTAGPRRQRWRRWWWRWRQHEKDEKCWQQQ